MASVEENWHTSGDSDIAIPSNAGRECVATALKICSFSGLRSSLLHPDRDVRAGMELSRTIRGQAKGRRCYLTQNIGPAVAESEQRYYLLTSNICVWYA